MIQKNPTLFTKKYEKKPSLMMTIFTWSLVVIALCTIGFLIYSNPDQPQLTCARPAGQNSLIGFGSCTTN